MTRLRALVGPARTLLRQRHDSLAPNTRVALIAVRGRPLTITSSAASEKKQTRDCDTKANAKPSLKALTTAQQNFLDRAIRVNQSGELAATFIYAFQTPPIVRREPHLGPLMSHMHAQEASHLQVFNTLLVRHRVRPSLLNPAWILAAAVLGHGTGLMGRRAAMACTEAVESEIGDHYNAQIGALFEMVAGWEAEGHGVGDEFRDLLTTLKRIRDEELQHLDRAVDHDARMAEPHWLLTGIIRAGCRAAIWLGERV